MFWSCFGVLLKNVVALAFYALDLVPISVRHEKNNLIISASVNTKLRALAMGSVGAFMSSRRKRCIW